MKNTLLDISARLEPSKAAVLASVDRAARKQNIPFFVVGAAARDFLLQYAHAVHTPRATNDVDVGVMVSSWDQYSKLIEALVREERFTATSVIHRFESPGKILVDIMPFGPIENGNRTIQWPEGDREMDMTGFTEAYKAAIDVKILATPSTVVKVVSLAGLALLKLLSWNDKPLERDRDAKDFHFIMHNYLAAEPDEYVFDIHLDIAGDGDYDLISARCLGRDMMAIAGKATGAILDEVLHRECDTKGNLFFVQQMREYGSDHADSVNKDIEMLAAVHKGIADRI